MGELDSLKLLLQNAGVPREDQEGVISFIGEFVGAMSIVLSANKLLAPNYLTFSLKSEKGERFELTIRRSEGKTPCDRLTELENEIERLRKQPSSLYMTIKRYLKKLFQKIYGSYSS